MAVQHKLELARQQERANEQTEQIILKSKQELAEMIGAIQSTNNGSGVDLEGLIP